MTFLLFLASIAVMEYLTRGHRQRSPMNQESPPGTSVEEMVEPVSAQPATSDLLALGKALGSPQAAPAPNDVTSVQIGPKSSPAAPEQNILDGL